MLRDFPDVLTVQQLAHILGIGINSAYRLIKERKIGCIRVGKKILILKLCVADYLNSARYTVSQDDNSRRLSERRRT